MLWNESPRWWATWVVGVVAVFAGVDQAADPAPATETLWTQMPVRNIGPANMSGRVVEIAAVESDPKIQYVATATGGVWKTTDGGATFQPIFDAMDTLTMGAIALCQGKPEVLYAGTGEGNPRNSSSWGRGVYKSENAGKTWKPVGLSETHHIGRIVVHPKNPDVAYVAAVGRFWGANPERGVFLTRDGGKTWTHSLALDDLTGVVDLVMDPSDPDTLFASAYPVRRDAFHGGAPATQWGPKGGLYKTTDAGKTWTKLTKGLPDRPYGRCGLSIWRKNPNVIYAVIQTDKTEGPTDNRGQVQKPNEQDIDKGGIFRSDDKGTSWKKLNDLCPRPFYYGQIRVDPTDDKRIYVLGVAFHVSNDGGKTFAAPAISPHSDHHALWINPQDSNLLSLGNDGGFYTSKDKGKNWTTHRHMPLGQFYGIAVDMSTPYRVVGGLQDNGSWGGPSATRSSLGIGLTDWKRLYGADGFQAACDPTNPSIVFVSSQYGGLRRMILNPDGTPKLSTVPKKNSDEDDSCQPKVDPKEAPLTSKAIKPIPAKGAALYRFNWNSPLLMSAHNPKVLYYAANRVFRTADRGDSWSLISRDLTNAEPGTTGSRHTISALGESPKTAGMLYAGTDDGRLHLTRDDGKTWTELTKNLPQAPKGFWVSRIECSAHQEETAFVTLECHRIDNFQPYLYKTTDAGKTWTLLVEGLPKMLPIHVIRQSSRNENLLVLGTEYGLWASLDGGKKWIRHPQIPAVPVHDLVIHPRDRELVIGTHGRSIYVMDVAPLEVTAAKFPALPNLHLFAVKSVFAEARQAPDDTIEVKTYRGENPPFGAVVDFWVPQAAEVTLTIQSADRADVLTQKIQAKAGLNRYVWPLTQPGKKDLVPPGDYAVMLTSGNAVTGYRFEVLKPR